jgi:hypothetical protein
VAVIAAVAAWQLAHVDQKLGAAETAECVPLPVMPALLLCGIRNDQATSGEYMYDNVTLCQLRSNCHLTTIGHTACKCRRVAVVRQHRRRPLITPPSQLEA